MDTDRIEHKRCLGYDYAWVTPPMYIHILYTRFALLLGSGFGNRVRRVQGVWVWRSQQFTYSTRTVPVTVPVKNVRENNSSH